jgi:hypothetical protein
MSRNSKKDSSERLDRLIAKRETADKLRVLLDSDVQNLFDERERDLIAAVTKAATSTDIEAIRVASIRLTYWRELRQLISGAVASVPRINKEIADLNDSKEFLNA